MSPRFAHFKKFWHILSRLHPLGPNWRSGPSALLSAGISFTASLLSFPTTPSGFLCLPEAPSASSFPSVAGNRLNSIELSSCFSLLSCTFQLIECSPFSFCSLHFRGPNDASVSFLLISVFLRKTMTVTCLRLYSIWLFKIRELKKFP